LSVTGDGTGVIAHAGSVAVRMLADRTGLTGALSAALARQGFTPGHDRGRVLVDVATMITAGGEAIADIDTLRHQQDVLGAVASPPTVWRTLDELTPAALKRIDHARAKTRARVWSLVPGGLPASTAAGMALPADVVVLDVDATIVVAHSEKEQATATFKKTFGYHPIGVWCDNSQELLAASLRPGNAGSNTTADHIEVLTRAIAQVPAGHRRKLLVRADGAGASHGLLEWLTVLNTAGRHGRRGRSVEYSVGFALTETVRAAICRVPKEAWTPAVAADGQVRDHADVVEITDLLTLTRWPSGIRVIVRREHPHPGAQLSLFEHRDGWRYQAFVTNTALGQVGFLEARHRAHAVLKQGRRPDPGRQRHRPVQVPLPRVRHQPSVADPGRHRRRPDRLAAAAGTAAGLGLLRTQGVAVSVPAHARPPDAGLPPATPPDARDVALGPGRRRDLHQRAGHPNAHLSRRPRPLTAHDQEPRRPAPPRHAAIPRTPNSLSRNETRSDRHPVISMPS